MGQNRKKRNSTAQEFSTFCFLSTLDLTKVNRQNYESQQSGVATVPNLCNKIEMTMATTIQQTITTSYTGTLSKTSAFSRFISWCEGQQKNHFIWLALALVGHGCVLTPITLFAIILSGNFIFFWMMAIIAMMSALVTNLSAMPTKYTIPVFLFSIVMDLVIIFSCIALGFDLSATL